VAAAFAIGASMAVPSAFAADLPKVTTQMLQTLKLDASVLDGLDQELAVPDAWIEGAKKEKKVRAYGIWEEAQDRVLMEAFRARYPFVEVDYQNAATRQQRSVRPLIALKEGKVIVDVISSLGSQVNAFSAAGALMRLDDLPTYGSIPAELKHSDKEWITHKANLWCLAYNTKKLKPADMPPTWDGFLDAAKWGNGKIGLGDRPNLWLLQAAGVKGQDWARNFMDELFGKLKPQLRKEGMSMLMNLMAAGEMDVVIPAAHYEISEKETIGAPVGWHCPEPVPVVGDIIAIMKQSPSPNAAKLYVNWLLSREGQLAHFAATESMPVHPGLKDTELSPKFTSVKSKQVVYQSPKLLEEDWPQLGEYWNAKWKSGAR
jgi:iron(III) transport system substrate-binding protein